MILGKYPSKKRAHHALAAVGFAVAAGFAAQASAVALNAYNVDPNSVSVSGLSSGGFMAAQLGVAYSDTFKVGFGVFAGGPFDCARSQMYTTCMYNNTPSITTATNNMRSWSGSSIDSTANLANRKIYMQVGTSDTTVGPNPMAQLRAQLANFYNSANVSYVTTSGAAHTFPTDFSGSGDSSCSFAASPYISNCGYDGAGAVLKWMYGSLNPRNTGTSTGTVVSFDQTGSYGAAGMDSTGYLYVPRNCAPGGGTVCKLHVALHGCLQSHQNIGMTYINNTGYTMWADTNNIIILYPQAIPDYSSHSTWASSLLPNPNGCWDWVGWYGANADQHGGVQMAAIVNMVNKIKSGYSGGGTTTTTAGGGTTTTTATTTTTTATQGQCFNASNYAHVLGMRAYDLFGYAYAYGSNQLLGFDNMFYFSKLRQLGSFYYVVDNTCP
jgi:poly(3-hydroxybutyrate) depolymerase